MKQESLEDRTNKLVKVVFRNPSFGTNGSTEVHYLVNVIPKKTHDTLDDFAQMCGFKTIQSYISYLWPTALNVEYEECTYTKCLFKSDTTEMTIEFHNILAGDGDDGHPYIMLSGTTTTPAIVLNIDLIAKIFAAISPYTEGPHYTLDEIFKGTWNNGGQSIVKRKRKKKSQ